MSISLSTIATAMSAAAPVLTAGSKLFNYVGTLMESAEKAFATATANSGSSKKAVVLAAIQTIAKVIGENFEAIKEQVAAFIDVVKTAYNTVVSVTAPAPAA